MPTGYTDGVRNGSITTFRDFALLCARAFGACITMRDDPLGTPIPAEWTPSTRVYDEQEAAANKTLAELATLTADDAEARALAEYTDSVARWHERRSRRATERARYEAMLAHVEAWTPPTPDHQEMRQFMAKQLRESIDFDCGDRFDQHPVRLAGAAWLEKRREDALRSLAYARQHRDEEIARTNGRNAWLRALRASLGEAA